MAKQAMSEWEKELSRSIHAVKRAIKAFHKMGLKVEIDRDIETMDGRLVSHVYVKDRMPESGMIILQKHLFTIT